MFDRMENFLDLVGVSPRAAHALKNGSTPAKTDLKFPGVDPSRM